jgi:hypothetical protein
MNFQVEFRIKNSLVQVTTSEYPLDWGLKNSAKFYSRKSFSWTYIDDLKSSKALHRFLHGNGPHEDHFDSSDRFLNLLHYWQYPSSNLPPAMMKLLNKQATEMSDFSSKIIFSYSCFVQTKGIAQSQDNSWFHSRLLDWTRSFESLFSMLRADLCPYFYFVGEEFQVLFHARTKEQPMIALLSNSNRSLRKKLDENAIFFKMPYATHSVESEEQIRFLHLTLKASLGVWQFIPVFSILSGVGRSFVKSISREICT